MNKTCPNCGQIPYHYESEDSRYKLEAWGCGCPINRWHKIIKKKPSELERFVKALKKAELYYWIHEENGNLVVRLFDYCSTERMTFDKATGKYVGIGYKKQIKVNPDLTKE